MKPRTTTGRLPAIIALALGPLLVVGLLIGLSRPETKAVSAAVVNLDEAVTVGDQLVPMGRQLAAAMIEKDEQVDWTLADAPSASAGLRSGKYSAVVTIPKGFSAAATSFSANDAGSATQATIEVQVGQNAPLTDAAVAEQVSRLAVDTINATLTESYLDGIYVGFNTVGEQFTTIVDGARQLHDGTTKLADGAKEASQGVNQLAEGVGQLGTGATKLADGVDEFAAQTPKLVDGVHQLATGADQLLGQIPAYADGAAQAIGGVTQLRKGLDTMIGELGKQDADTGGLDQLVSGATQLSDGAAGLSAGLGQVDSTLKGLAQQPVTMPDEAATQAATGLAMQYFGCQDPTTPQCQGTIQLLSGVLKDTFAQGFSAGAGAGSTALNTPDPTSGQTLLMGASQLADGARQLSGGVGQLATELPKQTEEQLGKLTGGLTQLRDGAATLEQKAAPIVDNAPLLGAGATQLRDGINQLDDQVGALPAGVQQLATGARQLADGTTQAATGATKAADGISQLADGAADLDDGVGTFASELAKGADQVPSYSSSDREKLSSVVASPIERADGVIQNGAVPLVTLLLTVGLWLGALAGFVVVRPVPRNVVASRASSAALWGRTVWLPLAILAGQGLLLGIVGAVVLELNPARAAGLAVLLAAVGVSFGLANHALAAWLGNVGRAIAGVLAAVTVALGLSSAVGWLAPAGAVSPLQSAFLLVRTWLSGGSGEVGLASVAVLMAAIAGLLSLASIAARRRLTAAQFRRAA
ncbi:MAG: YhgE/Pip domain-containing protein [Arachnia sp.]